MALIHSNGVFYFWNITTLIVFITSCDLEKSFRFNTTPGSRLALLFARPAVTFPAAEHHHPLAGTKLYCLMAEAHRCEKLAQCCYAAFARSRIRTHDLLITSPRLYPLHLCATFMCHKSKRSLPIQYRVLITIMTGSGPNSIWAVHFCICILK